MSQNYMTTNSGGTVCKKNGLAPHSLSEHITYMFLLLLCRGKMIVDELEKELDAAVKKVNQLQFPLIQLTPFTSN